MGSVANAVHREPWNKGKIVGQKAPFKVKDIWALRVRLQMENRVRELALFNLGIDSKLRGCDLVSLKVRDICHGDQVASRAMVMQHKTQRPVQFEITPATRDAVQKWIKQAGLKSEDFVFPSRIHDSPHLGTRQYARIPKRATESGSPGRWWRVHPKCKTPTRVSETVAAASPACGTSAKRERTCFVQRRPPAGRQRRRVRPANGRRCTFRVWRRRK